MKRTIFHTIVALFAAITAFSQADAASCSGDFINTEKNLFKIYQKLQKNHSRCKYSGKTFLNYAQRAYLAGRYGESLRAVEYGISQKNPHSIQMQLRYMQGLAFLGRGRNEEAISSLKKVAMKKSPVAAKELETRQRAHLALIEAYYAKSNNKNDKNVQFLTHLFRRRYPQSRYLPILEKWFKSSSLP